MESLYIDQTKSTNALLWEMLVGSKLHEGFVVQAGYQSDGKGQIGNSWESEPDKNLLFSIVIYPNMIPVSEQFLISQFISIALVRVLEKHTESISIKWPNDIYWKDKKIAGILIENTLQGGKIKSSVIGVGLNVNQKEFLSNAPNPVSLAQITGNEFKIGELLEKIHSEFINIYKYSDIEKIRFEYSERLFWKNGIHAFRSETENFNAKIVAVHSDGQLELETEDGEKKEFYFKEVAFVI